MISSPWAPANCSTANAKGDGQVVEHDRRGNLPATLLADEGHHASRHLQILHPSIQKHPIGPPDIEAHFVAEILFDRRHLHHPVSILPKVDATLIRWLPNTYWHIALE